MGDFTVQSDEALWSVGSPRPADPRRRNRGSCVHRVKRESVHHRNPPNPWIKMHGASNTSSARNFSFLRVTSAPPLMEIQHLIQLFTFPFHWDSLNYLLCFKYRYVCNLLFIVCPEWFLSFIYLRPEMEYYNILYNLVHTSLHSLFMFKGLANCPW